MAKAIRKIGQVVGTVLVVAGFITGNPALIIAGQGVIATTQIVAQIIDIISPPSGGAAFQNEGNPLQFQTNPQSGLPCPMGRTRMSGLKIGGKTAASSGSVHDMLFFAALLSATPAAAIEGFSADNIAVTFDGSGQAVGSDYAGYMAQSLSLGSVPQPSALMLSLNGVGMPGWTSGHKLSGRAHALWALRYDKDGKHYQAGLPEPAWIGRWRLCYDPRKDSSYPGGSGSHRADNESSWEWSRNPGLLGLAWVLGHFENGRKVCGMGAPIAAVRVADFVECANVCDANGWGCGGVEWTTDSKWDILKRILQAGGAVPRKTGAMIGCLTNTPRVSIATVTGADLLDGLRTPMMKRRRDRFNTVLPRYVSEEHGWEVITGAAVSVPAFVTEDGGARTKGLDFPMVQAETGQPVDGNRQAGELATYAICNSREAGPWEFSTGPKFLGLATGDCITLDAPDEGISAQKLLITSVRFDPASATIQFTADTETDAKHSYALGNSTTPPAAPTLSVPPPSVSVPDAADWTVAPIALANGQAGLRLSGTIADPVADTVLVGLSTAGAGAWQDLTPLSGAGALSLDIGPIDSAASWDVRLAYSARGRAGDWLEISGVSTDDSSLLNAVALGASQLVNSHFRDGLNQWKLGYAGLAANAALTMSSGRASLASSAPSNPSGAGGDPFASLATSDGSTLYGGHHLFRVTPGQRLAVRIKGTSSASAKLWPYFRFLALSPGADLPGSGYGTAFSGFTNDLRPSADEAAAFIDVPAGAYWLDIEFYGYVYSSTAAVSVLIDALQLSFIDPAQTVPPAWSEGPTGAYRADVTGENTANDTANVGGIPTATLLTTISNISSDSVLSASEKPQLKREYDALYENWFALNAKAVSLGVAATERSNASTAMNALITYLGTLSPGWTTNTADTAIVKGTFDAKWNDAYSTVAALQAAIQGLPGVDALTVSPATTITVPATAGGVPKGAIPGFSLKVFKGTTDVTASASYTIDAQSGVSGATHSGGGVFTGPTGMTADTGYVQITVTKDGVSATLRQPFAKQFDGPAYVRDATAPSLPGSTSYAQVALLSLLMGPNGTLKANGGSGYTSASASGVGVVGYFEYRINGGGWSTLSGSTFSGTLAGSPGIPGFWSSTNTVSGSSIGLSAKSTVDVRIMAAKTNTDSMSVLGTPVFELEWTG